MNNRVVLLILWLIVWVGVIVWVYYFINSSLDSNSLTDNSNKDISSDSNDKWSGWIYDQSKCEIIEKDVTVASLNMFPMLRKWEILKFKQNFYNCWNNQINVWDILIYENQHTHKKNIYRVAVKEWDVVETNKEDWTVKSNWKILANSLWEVYKFSENQINWFDIYSYEDWVFKNWQYFILSDNIKDSFDSRLFWPITKEWVIWKVIVEK